MRHPTQAYKDAKITLSLSSAHWLQILVRQNPHFSTYAIRDMVTGQELDAAIAAVEDGIELWQDE